APEGLLPGLRGHRRRAPGSAASDGHAQAAPARQSAGLEAADAGLPPRLSYSSPNSPAGAAPLLGTAEDALGLSVCAPAAARSGPNSVAPAAVAVVPRVAVGRGPCPGEFVCRRLGRPTRVRTCARG